MSEERRRILEMLAQGKVSVDEAERLMQAMGQGTTATAVAAKRNPRYLLVKVDDPKEGTNVNIRVPLQLVRAGVKLNAFLPKEAQQQIDHAMEAKGVSFDLSSLTPETLDEFLEGLGDLALNVDTGDGTVVRIYCE